MKLERVAIALIAAVLFITIPIVNPDFADTLGNIFQPLFNLTTELLTNLVNIILQYQDNAFEYLIGAGVSAPLTFGLVSLLKRLPFIVKFDTRNVAFVVALILYSAMIVAQRGGFEVEWNNAVQVALLIVSLLAGGSTAMLGGSKIHNKLVESDLPIAYHKTKKEG